MPSHTQPTSPQYQAALAIARTLRQVGHQAFFAGGCVRDLLLGLAPKDYDVATSATPDQIVALFPRTLTVGAHFGVVLVCTSQPDAPDIPTEVATFRSDGAYSDGRRPDAVRYTSDPREDVLRRDFTINGMLLDPIAYEATGDLGSAVLDYVGGRDDLRRGVVRAIGDPKLRYAEDKLRLLRAVRFAARLNFHLEVEGIRCKAADITQVSRRAHSRRADQDPHRGRRRTRLRAALPARPARPRLARGRPPARRRPDARVPS